MAAAAPKKRRQNMKAALRRLAMVMVILATLSLGGCAWFADLFGEETDIGLITWDRTAEDWSDNTYGTYKVTLPSGGTEWDIWGTDIYTDDSPIGTAAVHAGLITFSGGGTVKIQILPGESSYVGSFRNGVGSENFGAWSASFKFVDAND